jgi:hypothetical protein
MGQAADLLLEIARKADDIVEQRRAADALVRLLLGPSTRRSRTDNRTDNRSANRTDSRIYNRSDSRAPGGPPSHAAPPSRPTSTPTAPPPMPPLPVPLPDSFLALLPPDHPLRQPSPHTQHPESHTTHDLPRSPTNGTGGRAFQPAATNELPSHPLYTSTIPAGAPQSHNTS